ncbi:MAG: type I DNA topoisomerase [Bacteroides sp.]|nr:type I DNA topoisomerase [Bacteroides sp.]MCM1379638.1 type I DNA topoisomerase [Bacteroides sp.]MCM1445980.1 type I DNA topoisomerase [Prevotella sp.]
MNLVIVESPAKAKTIEKFLGPDYQVLSSKGHIRDLAKKSFKEEPDGSLRDFTPNYEIPDDKKEQVRQLKAAAKKADMVWLASDEDREGEAIAWHLAEVLGLKPEKTRRIVFHEITKTAILNAIKNPREIDIDRVNAQQARRVLDRVVGFELSPVLWRKIKPSLSAGRVQSVAVRLIVDREKEIKAFTPEEYWRINASFLTANGSALSATLSRRLDSRAAAEAFLKGCSTAKFTASKVEKKPVKRSPAPPFTTSTLQQEAARKLGFSVTQTMRIAQDLYEAGHITYMRTDSLNLSEFAISAISKNVTEKYGKQYLKVRHYHTSSKGAQEAHEAIRPTYIDKETIPGDERAKKLYRLIRERAIASQMADMELERTTIDIAVSGQEAHFSASGDVITFDGFRRVYDDTDERSEAILPHVGVGDALTVDKLTATERYTSAPARYSEAALVKKMEELGIGRPSTYAPTIATIQQREYVARGENPGEKNDYTVLTLDPSTAKISASTETETTGGDRGKLVPTDTGIVVNDFLAEYFPDILDYNFTAQVEERFDDIAEGKSEWHDEIGHFYSSFHPEVEKALSIRLDHKVGERLLGTDPASGKPVSVKIGRFGPLVQIGDAEGDEKPQFASLLKGQSISSITLDEALKLFEFPRTLGTFEDKDVSVAIGRFGPYVKHDGKFASIPKGIEPASVTLDQAVEFIVNKRTEEANRLIKTFDEEPDLQLLNGRFGPYIVYQKANYKLPRSISDPSALTYEEVKEIIANQPAPKAKRTAKKK